MPSRIAKRFCRYISQEVCPWNERFASALAEGSPFAPREAIVGRDARTLAREPLAMSQGEFSATFKGSPMKRAKLRGLKRNAAVALGNVGTRDDVAVLTPALDDEEPLVRAHAAWALGRIGSSAALAAVRARTSDESDASVLAALRAALSGSNA